MNISLITLFIATLAWRGIIPTLLPASPLKRELQSPSDDGWAAIADWIAAYMNSLFIEGMKAVATTLWYLEKIAAGITRFLTEEDMWELVLNSTLGTLRETMPEILNGLIFSNSGTGGLIYLALFMAGLLMIIPNMSHIRLVDPTRVITWGVIVTVLFLSAATPWGYDLIGLVEQMRAGAVQVVIDTAAEDGDLDALVAQPMMATDTDLENYSFVLPQNFIEQYFSEAEDSDYEERTVTFIDSSFFTWEMLFEVESSSSQEERRENASTGLAISGLTLIPGVVLLMFGFIFATLTASALILIVFFLVSLPLGFFEFGAAILNGILKQYAYLWAITLLSVVLPGILIAAETLAYPDSGPPAPGEIMAFIPILVVVTIATSYVSAMATSAMTDTFSVISTSISTSMASLNYAGSMPQGGILGGGPLQGAANIAATAALAAATGGASAALMAGGGALLSGVSSGGGKAAGQLATGLMGAERASVFATAARGTGAAGVAGAAGRQQLRRRRQRERAEQAAGKKFSASTRTPKDKIPNDQQHFNDAGSYLTLHTSDLDRAEEAFGRGEYTTARFHLTRAFGSREVANQAMNQYRQHGRQGMRKVRDCVYAAQATAQGMASQGQPLFDAKGKLTGDFRKQTWAALKKRKSVDTSNQEDAALAAQIAGTSVRQPIGIWKDPFATGQLAANVFENPEEPHPYCQDTAAAFALHDMATSQGWTKEQVEAVFCAAQEAQAVALSGKKMGIDAIAQRMNMHGEFANTPPGVCREAARLGLLVIGQISCPVGAKANQPPVRLIPTPRELAHKVLFPDSAQVLPKSESTLPAIGDLNHLATTQGWEDPELTTLFNVTRAAQETTLQGGDTYVDVVARNLAAISCPVGAREFLNTPDPIRREAATLALRVSYGTTLAPNTPEAPPRSAQRTTVRPQTSLTQRKGATGQTQVSTARACRGAPVAQAQTPIAQAQTATAQAQTPVAQAQTPIAQAQTPVAQAATSAPSPAVVPIPAPIEAPQWLNQVPVPEWDGFVEGPEAEWGELPEGPPVEWDELSEGPLAEWGELPEGPPVEWDELSEAPLAESYHDLPPEPMPEWLSQAPMPEWDGAPEGPPTEWDELPLEPVAEWSHEPLSEPMPEWSDDLPPEPLPEWLDEEAAASSSPPNWPLQAPPPPLPPPNSLDEAVLAQPTRADQGQAPSTSSSAQGQVPPSQASDQAPSD